MPFVSKAQKGWLYSKEPEVAKEFEEHTPKSAYKNMSYKVKDKNGLKAYTKKHKRKK